MNNIFLFAACSDAGRIEAFEMNSANGELRLVPSDIRLENVRALSADHGKRMVHAVQNLETGILHTYTVGVTGELAPCSDPTPLPATLAYLTLDAEGTHLLGASYGENLVLSQNAKFPPSASNRSIVNDVGRAHAVLPSPDNRFVYYTSLATDKVFWCHFDATTGALSHHASVDVEPGSGPRHLRFSPKGEHVYVLNELSGTVTVFERDASTGNLVPKQSIGSVPAELNLIPGRPRSPITPDPPAESIWCAELRLTPDGRFLYTTERSSSTISIFERDPGSGTLTYCDFIRTEKQPRGMNIDPTGRYLTVAGELSNHISVYKIHASGSLSHLWQYQCGAGPMWIEFLEDTSANPPSQRGAKTALCDSAGPGQAPAGLSGSA